MSTSYRSFWISKSKSSVPIDDENTWTWSFNCNPHRDFNEEERTRYHPQSGMWGPVDEHFQPLLNKKNDYGLDRDLQRRVNFTGIQGVPNQDAAVQESMGPIADRSLENLGSSDKTVIAYRKLILEMARNLQGGEEPGAPLDGARYNIRSASLLLGKDVPFDKGAAALLSGSRERDPI